ncbi:MAG: hypothetical protein Kow0029_20480 [Candidatus Rifleibacteriota bacterium]
MKNKNRFDDRKKSDQRHKSPVSIPNKDFSSQYRKPTNRQGKHERKTASEHDRRKDGHDHHEHHDDGRLLIKGRHEVLNALEAGERLETIFISSGVHGSIAGLLREKASSAQITIKELSSETFERKFGKKSQGVVAVAGVFSYADFEDIVDRALAGSQVLVALNQVEDPRNLGAIVRTVEASGCSGVIIPKNRAAGMTEWAIRTAQGAAAYLPVCRVTNLADSIRKIKEKGFWVVGLDGAAEKKFTDAVYNGPVLLVAGGEDAGLGERVKNSCDELVAIPLLGKTASLNVSVSTAIVLFEICRQKDFFKNCKKSY